MAECKYRAMFFKELDIDYNPEEEKRLFNKETILKYADYLIRHKEPFSLAICIADSYQFLNKNYGNNDCANLLTMCRESLFKAIGEKGMVAKYGDDRYLVLLDGMNEYNDVWMVFHNVNMDLQTKKILNGEVPVSFTTGISRYPIDNQDVEGLVLTTKKALVRGKEKGKPCFIIYLAAKHSHIVLNEVKVTEFSTVEIISDLFNIANKSKTIKDLIDGIIKELGDFMNPDHLSVQSKNAVLAKFIGTNCQNKEVPPMDYNSICNRFDDNGLFFVNARKAAIAGEDRSLYEFYVKNTINSALCVEIACNDAKYGILRVEMVGNSHTWESKDKVLYTFAAKLLGTIIYNRSKNEGQQ